MKKLNPFQMPPHENESQPSSGNDNANNNNNNNALPPSTSHDINPTSAAECEKENLRWRGGENQFEESMPPAANNNNNNSIIITNDTRTEAAADCVNSENPDVFNVVLMEQQAMEDDSRPRQYGRRSNPLRISSIPADPVNHTAAVISFLFHFFVYLSLARVYTLFVWHFTVRAAD